MKHSNQRQKLEYVNHVLELFDQFIDMMPTRFDRKLFKRLRQSSFSQVEWAAATSVAQGTIGNWERGITTPMLGYRRALYEAAIELREDYEHYNAINLAASNSLFDPVKTSRQLQESILRAALTDFQLASDGTQIIPMPFSNDVASSDIDELETDRINLLNSLAEQSEAILEELEQGANVPTDKLKRYLERYRDAARVEIPNPRLLNSFGQTISRSINEEDFVSAITSIDQESMQGFVRDHLELMRLYFREALAKAQEIESADIVAELDLDDGKQFSEIAELMEEAKSEHGEPLISKDIPTLLRDISREMRELSEAISFSYDQTRKNILSKRKSEAFKVGSVYVGRFVFFTALISSVSAPGVVGYVGSLASIIGVLEIAAPGTVRKKYEKLRETFPVLPQLPELDRSNDK